MDVYFSTNKRSRPFIPTVKGLSTAFMVLIFYSTGASGFFGMNTGAFMQGSMPAWTRQLGTTRPGFGQSTEATGAVVDSSGNVYITGSSYAGLDGNIGSGNNDCIISKYNTSGTKQWTKQLGTITGGTSCLGIAIDSNSNIYVTGSAGGGLDGNTLTGYIDFFISKFDSSGTKLWTRQLGVSGFQAYGNGVAVDSTGNAYVTGFTDGGLGGNTLVGTIDFFISKYNTSGTLQWTKQLGVTGVDTRASSVAVDVNSNAYVCGYTFGGLDGNTLSGVPDFFITKYNTSGVKQWTRQLGASAASTWGTGIAVDSSSNVYISGSTDNGLDGNTETGTADFFISKYNTSGTKQWTRQLGVSAVETRAMAIAVDTSSNVYLTGNTYGGLDANALIGFPDFFITKYNGAGTKQWTRQLGTAGAATNGTAIAVDSGGNAYIAGRTEGGLDGNTLSGFSDFFISKYSTLGVKQWTKQLGTSGVDSSATCLAVDSSANIYVAGSTNGGFDGNTIIGNYDFYISKYNTSGIRQWTKQLGVSGADTYAAGIAVDSGGNSYITGFTYGGLDGNILVGTADFFVTKYSSSGVKQWTAQLGASGAATYGNAIAVDSSGNAFIVGSTHGNLDGNTLTGTDDLFISKFNTSGTKLWTIQLGAASFTSYGTGVAVDSSGNVFATAVTFGGLSGNSLTGSSDCFIGKFNTSGTSLWTRQFGVSAVETNCTSVAIDSSSNAYVGGLTAGGLGGNTLTGNTDFFISKFNASGTNQWTRQLGVGGANTIANGIGVDSGGNSYVGGDTSGGLDGNTLHGNNDFFISKYNISGARQWTKQLGVGGASTFGSGVRVDTFGNVYGAGSTNGGIDGNTVSGLYDFFLIKYGGN